jgi:trk system potassium uptake protein
MSSPRKLFIVIVGCGRSGAYLANRMSREGHSLVVIDADSGAFDSLSVAFSGFKVEGDATELAVLRQAKIDKADLVIAAATDDNINLMVAQIAKKIFRVPRVIARVFQPDRENIYQALGIDTLCPTTLFGDLVGDIYLEPPLVEIEGPGEKKT